MQDTLIVISKYEENIDWVYKLKHPYIVYDKSTNPLKISIPRPNIGREAETLLYYIITKYDSLPNKTIFLQGDPRSNPVAYSYEQVIDELNKEHDSILKPILTWEGHTYIDDYWLKTCSILNSILFDNNPIVKYSSGAQYVIPKENILNRPLDLYIALHRLVIKFGNRNLIVDLNSLELGIDAWTMELLWGSIFDKEKILKNDCIGRLHKLIQITS
jgi:hypothetical protein